MRHELCRVLRRWEMAQLRHRLEIRPGYLIRRLLAHLGGIRPIELTREQVNGAFLDVDLAHAIAAVPTTEVEVEISVEDAVSLAGVEVPDELFVHGGRGGSHHL